MYNFFLKFFLLLKRQFKSKVFCFISLSIPLLSIGALQTNTDSSSLINIAFYLEPSSDFCEKIASNLENYNGLFSFIEVDSEKDLYKLVANSSVECGYIFPNDLLADLDRGKRRNRVTLIYSSKTTMQKISNEIVYAEIFQEYALHLLQNILSAKPTLEHIPLVQLNNRINFLYRNALIDGSTFSFQYFDTTNNTKYTTLSLFKQTFRGLFALLLSIGSLLGALTFLTDQENGLYKAVSIKHFFIYRFLTILVPTFLLSLAIYPALLFSGLSKKWIVSFFLIVIYVLLSTLITSFFSILIPKKNIFAACIPLYILATFICTPIFLDFSMFFPIFRFFRYFFLPYYFLLF